MKACSKEKREIIQSFQDAIGNSKQRLEIIKKINKKESITELANRLKIPQSTMSMAVTRFKSYNLIILISKKGKSEIYDKIPLLKTFSNLGSLVKIELKEENFEPRTLKKTNKKSNIPFLEYSDEKNADDMAIPYRILYLFENSLRKFINKILISKYGEDWWNKVNIKNDLNIKVKARQKKEKENRWHVRRGLNEIFYTDLDDLTYLLNKERLIFVKEISLEYWIPTITHAVSLSRNIVDHHNPLPDKEIKRLKIILDDWKRQFN